MNPYARTTDLCNAITCSACPNCFSLNKYGFAIQYYLWCTNDNYSWAKTFWSSTKPEHCRSFVINRVIYAVSYRSWFGRYEDIFNC